ncbi:MAG: hypothetical protein ACN6PW_02620 [Pseudomonas kermanshahensis]|uniref:hypothetical protein n=1 Tax=Pseudomonas kermanshahensis TaxID=2745482 RepID=UPI003D0C5416
MPNLICTTEIDAALIDQFSAEGTGFPDQTLLNPQTGKPDASVLEKMIGVTRAIRRLESKVKPGSRLADFQRTSAGRFKLLLNDLHNLHLLSHQKAKRVVGVRSWEGVVFGAIDSTWLEPTGAAAQRFNVLTQEDQDALEGMLSSRLEWVETAKSLDSEKREFLKRREYFKPLAGMVGLLLDQLECWGSLPDTQKQLVADAVYALATPFGNELLGIFVTRLPDLTAYYSVMLEDERQARSVDKSEDAESESTEAMQASSDTTAPPLSLYDLYSELFQLAQQAKGDAGNLHYAEQIEALITSNLPRLKQEYSLSEDTVRKILCECVEVLVGIGRDLSLQIFDDEEFLMAFKTAWLEYFNERLQEEVAEAFLGDMTETRAVDSKGIKTRLLQAEALRGQIDSELIDLNVKLSAANFREKSEIRSSITAAEESRVKSNKEHQEVEQDGCSLLLPPGYDIDTLATDGHEAVLTVTAYHPSAKAAIQAWSKPTDEQEDALQHALTPTADTEHEPDALPKADIEDTETTAASSNPSEEMQPLPVVEPINQVGSEAEDEPDLKVGAAVEPELTVMPEIAAQHDGIAEITIPDDTVMVEQSDSSSSAETVDEAVNVLEYCNSPTKARERLEHCQQTMDVMPAIAVENIALLWIRAGQLPLASKTLELAGRVGFAGDLLSLPLVQAAYQGMHVWRGDSATVTRVQQNMNQLSSEIIESWMDRRRGGRVAPYLVFAATLQPTLFCGTMTNAPRLLSSVLHYFDGATAKLIEEVVNFASHNTRLDLDTLREQPTSHDKEARSKLAGRLVEWHDRILNKQTGWAPARKAMKECLARDEFELTYQSITRDDASRVDEVRAFADFYREKEEQNRLMSSEIHRVMNESTSVPQIEGNARNWFLRSMDEIVGIADLWVEGHSLQGRRSSEVSKFAPRLLTMLTAAVNHLTERAGRTAELEHHAGLRIAITALERITRVAERHDETIWEISRVSGWLQWPTEWLATSTDDDVQHQLATLTSLLEKGIDNLALADQALERKSFRHALLLTLNHRDENKEPVTDNVQAIKRLFSEEVYQCNTRSVEMRGLLDDANIASLIDDERHYQLTGELEHLQDQLKNLRMLDDLSEIHASLDELQASIVAKFSSKKEELERSLEALTKQALVDRGVDWVPAGWLTQIRSALSNHDTTVAEEMLGHLKHSLESGSALESDAESGTDLLKRFLALEPKLHSVLAESRNKREVVRHLAGEHIDGLSLESLPSYFKSALEDLVGLRRRVKALDKATYEELVKIFYAIGLEAVHPAFTGDTPRRTGFTSHGRISHLTMTVKPRDTGRGIVFFNQKSEAQSVNILLATTDWTIDELRTLVTEQTHFLYDRTILLSGRELSNEERNGLAKFSKQQKHTLLHVDPVLLAMLAGLGVPDQFRLKTFLQLSLPWTFSNPYTGNQMQPAPPEMRYGRQSDIKSLITMRNGAAMIFGGRQLGKTTLLNETQRCFHNPEQHRHAFLHQMDGNLDRANLSGDELDKHRKNVWGKIYGDAVTSGMIKPSYGLDTAGMVAALSDYFRKDNPDSLMVCLDEIDPILGLDAANGFRIFRELSGLVNNSNGRFKVVIAGLENVRRFADAPNYPLHQLGSAIQVSIMSPAEALQLIREPLGYLGYEFDSPLLMNRILVETNRHPGLIHIVCHELIQTLSARHDQRIGSTTVTADDIEQIRKDPLIRQLICDRFDITLNLDLRYKLIAYSLIAQSTSSFSPSRAKAIVEEWAPQLFEPMTEAQFEAFLDELCGLGVLQHMRRAEGGKEYALRNANIMNLVGGPQKIADKLFAAVDAIHENDPLSAHAYPENATRPSPLTLRDEKLLISEDAREKPLAGAIEARSSNYSVGVITGSEALGLNPQWMEESLLAIGEEEPVINNISYGRYHAYQRKDTELGSPSDFKKLLHESVLNVQSNTKHIMLFVELTGSCPLTNTLDLLDVAHEARLHTNAKRNRVRLVFLMTPRALWQWESHPELIAGREAQQPFIALDVWKTTALAHLLNKLELENTSTSVATLERYSQGWYFSLDKLLAAKSKKSDVVRISSFGQAYTSLLQAKPKSMDEFLHKAGVYAVDWAKPVLSALCEEERFDEDDLELQLMESYENVNPQQARHWLSRLRLIVPCKSNSKKSLYCVPESIKAALLIKSPQEARA